jgi:rhodanese-related sulfurtransferase
VRKNLSQFIIDGALVIDVRSPEEFSSGHFDNSINIPLPQLKAKASTLDQTKPILLCCASGNRSGMGTALLKGIGFKNVMNAGPWSSLKK